MSLGAAGKSACATNPDLHSVLWKLYKLKASPMLGTLTRSHECERARQTPRASVPHSLNACSTNPLADARGLTAVPAPSVSEGTDPITKCPNSSMPARMQAWPAESLLHRM